MSEQLDFVVLWVDGSDPEWQKERAKYSPYGDTSEQRYRNWDIFKYWFRGVEKYASWVRKVHLVTWGHLPSWLNTDNPKLHIVNHRDFMPEKYLPTFSSNPLELNLHRIEGLTENFVYFNDDMHLIDYVKPTDFFRDGKPVDMLALQPVVANPNNPVMSFILLNDALLISRHFDKRERMRAMPGKFFKVGYPLKYFVYNLLETSFSKYTGFYTVHGSSPLMKSTFRELWECEGEYLDKVCMNRFRSQEDVCQYIFRDWEKQKGNFVPENLHKKFRYIEVSDKDAEMIIRKRKRPIVCINDSYMQFDFERKSKAIRDALCSILPEKSSFEK